MHMFFSTTRRKQNPPFFILKKLKNKINLREMGGISDKKTCLFEEIKPRFFRDNV
jgi:hypothetical protein